MSAIIIITTTRMTIRPTYNNSLMKENLNDRFCRSNINIRKIPYLLIHGEGIPSTVALNLTNKCVVTVYMEQKEKRFCLKNNSLITRFVTSGDRCIVTVSAEAAIASFWVCFCNLFLHSLKIRVRFFSGSRLIRLQLWAVCAKF